MAFCQESTLGDEHGGGGGSGVDEDGQEGFRPSCWSLMKTQATMVTTMMTTMVKVMVMITGSFDNLPAVVVWVQFLISKLRFSTQAM